jgi:hypothetical protein
MLELLSQFERAAMHFDAFALVVPGIICVAAGFFLWLGGMGHKISLALISGAAAGGACGLLISGRNLVTSAIAASVGAAAALFISRVFVALMAGILGTALSFIFIISPYLAEAESFQYKTADEGQRLDFVQTAEVAKAFGSYTYKLVETGKREMATWFIPPAIGLIFLAGGFLAKRITWTVCCSIVGTVLIFAGLILLLLYEGSEPISSIVEHRPFYRAVTAAMIAIGVLAQVVLSHREHGKRLGMTKKVEPDTKPAGEPT